MIKFETLDDLIKFIKNHHKCLQVSRSGAYGMKFIRKPDGKRIMFEEIRGFKIFDFESVEENSLRISQLACGYALKGKIKHTMSSVLFLSDLVLINVFDHAALFFSRSSIDFGYVENEFCADMEHLSEWLHNLPGIVRGRWESKDPELEKIINEIGLGRKVIEIEKFARGIDFECERFSEME